MNGSDNIIPLKCCSCGAALEIAPDVDEFACGYCGGQQIVLRRGGTIALKLIGESVARIQRGTDRTAAELAVRRLREDLLALEIERQERDSMLHRQMERLSSINVKSEPLIGNGTELILITGCFIVVFLLRNNHIEIGLLALTVTTITAAILIGKKKSKRTRIRKAIDAERDRIFQVHNSMFEESFTREERIRSEIDEHLSLLKDSKA